MDASVAAVPLLLANPDRKGVILWNDSTAAALIKFGTGASDTDFTWMIISQSGYEFPDPIYIGDVSAIWDSVDGAMMVTELL